MSLLLVFVLAALICGTILDLSRVLWRQELQTINRRFEARQWLAWSGESIRRLNPSLLWQYHEEHEIPRRWWAWDYTLSWLIENNHPAPVHKIVIFNHLLEDEPPRQAAAAHPWMEPLLHHPLPRRTVADMVRFLAAAGVRLIVLDNDFPQYTADDAILARAIHDVGLGARPVPVLIARTINRRSTGNVLELEVPSMPSGLIAELEKLEPGVDVVEKYTGITGTLPDEDQVVRRIALRLPGLSGGSHESLVIKSLKALGEPLPAGLPDELDIDFVGPPNSEIYPVRPLSYLLDPDRRKAMVAPPPGSRDVTLASAIVILGDGVVDVFSTPFTNSGVNQMSGAEILMQALETVSRGHWPTRLSGREEIVYLALASLLGGLVWTGWKWLQQSTTGSLTIMRTSRFTRTLSDLWCFLSILLVNYLVSCLLFSYKGLIVPLFVPSLSLGMGTLAALLWEREKDREETFKVRLQAAEERLVLAKERYEADSKRQEAEARAREVLMDRQRRHEFVRRINHDLNAPVSVLNWTLAELQDEGLDGELAREKIDRLIKGSDRLCELIDQLVQSYEYETPDEGGLVETVNLVKLVADAADMERPLARVSDCQIEVIAGGEDMSVRGNGLELSRIVDNLIRNAIKHNPPGTNVTVSVGSDGASHCLRVADSGRGIAPEHLPHIFEPGYRVDPERKDSQGLGLDIVKTLVERMGGHISVRSAAGRGTEFTIAFPAAGGAESAEREAGTKESAITEGDRHASHSHC